MRERERENKTCWLNEQKVITLNKREFCRVVEFDRPGHGTDSCMYVCHAVLCYLSDMVDALALLLEVTVLVLSFELVV